MAEYSDLIDVVVDPKTLKSLSYLALDGEEDHAGRVREYRPLRIPPSVNTFIFKFPLTSFHSREP